jgi:hypothetical protein
MAGVHPSFRLVWLDAFSQKKWDNMRELRFRSFIFALGFGVPYIRDKAVIVVPLKAHCLHAVSIVAGT